MSRKIKILIPLAIIGFIALGVALRPKPRELDVRVTYLGLSAAPSNTPLFQITNPSDRDFRLDATLEEFRHNRWRGARYSTYWKSIELDATSAVTEAVSSMLTNRWRVRVECDSYALSSPLVRARISAGTFLQEHGLRSLGMWMISDPTVGTIYSPEMLGNKPAAAVSSESLRR
jgi:hypothetical protein